MSGKRLDRGGSSESASARDGRRRASISWELYFNHLARFDHERALQSLSESPGSSSSSKRMSLPGSMSLTTALAGGMIRSRHSTGTPSLTPSGTQSSLSGLTGSMRSPLTGAHRPSLVHELPATDTARCSLGGGGSGGGDENSCGTTPISLHMARCLSQLAHAERDYNAMAFVVSQRDLKSNRRLSLQVAYEGLQAEFALLEQRGLQWIMPNTTTTSSSVADEIPTPDQHNVSQLSSESPSMKPSANTTAGQSPGSRSFLSFLTSGFKRSTSRTSHRLASSPSRDSITSALSSSSANMTSGINCTTDQAQDRVTGHICGQLHHYCVARGVLTGTYEIFVSQIIGPAFKFLQVTDLISRLQDASLESILDRVHHPIVSPLADRLIRERDILLDCLQALACIQDFQFLDALFHLDDAHRAIKCWVSDLSDGVTSTGTTSGLPGTVTYVGSSHLTTATATTTANSMSSSGSSSVAGAGGAIPLPKIVQFLNNFKLHLISKFCLYFNQILSQAGPPGLVRDIAASARTEQYIKRVTDFHRRSGAMAVVIIFNATGLVNFSQESYTLTGYYYGHAGGHGGGGGGMMDSTGGQPATKTGAIHGPAASVGGSNSGQGSSPQGMRNYPVIFRLPTDVILTHQLPGIIMNIQYECSYFYDKKLEYTYFYSPVEPRMTLVVIFDGPPRGERDREVIAFQTDFIERLKRGQPDTALYTR